MSFLLAQMKELKKTSTPAKFDFVDLCRDSEKLEQAHLFSRCSIGSPYMGRLRSGADNAALYTKVKSTIKGSILEFIGWRMEYMIEGHIGRCDQEE